MEFPVQERPLASGERAIKIIGVGGCGGNAVRHMISSGLHGAEFIAANTDAQALAVARVDRTVQLGPAGWYEGSDPEIGRQAAEESLAAIKDAIGEARLVFIVAGMGGRTGTGAAPVIARTAKENGAGLVVGVVTRPLLFEGKKRVARAEAGIAELLGHVDSLIVLSNEDLYFAAPKQAAFSDIFRQADNAMLAAVECISGVLTRPERMNLDFSGVARVLRGTGMAVMGVGTASGENRIRDAVLQALDCPLGEGPPLSNARGVLLYITAGQELTVAEADAARAAIHSKTSGDTVILIGTAFDESLADEARVAVIATSAG